jgi:hypothetical protein
VSVACVKTFIRIFVCEVLGVVWFLVCRLTVISALCSFLLCSSLCCRVLECFAGLELFFLL